VLNLSQFDIITLTKNSANFQAVSGATKQAATLLLETTSSGLHMASQAQGNRVSGGLGQFLPPSVSLKDKFADLIKSPISAFATAIDSIAVAGTIPGIQDWGKSIQKKANAAKMTGKLKDDPFSEEGTSYLMGFSDEGTSPTLYSEMNSFSYDKDRSKIAPYGPYMVGLTKHMRFMKKHPNGTVYRGVKCDLRKTMTQKKKDGKVVIFYGFTSTTKDMELLSKPTFCGQSGKRTFFIIKLTQGQARDITHYSLMPTESEVLLPPGCCFDVKSVAPQGPDLTVVSLEERHSDHWLIDLQMCTKYSHVGVSDFE
jgi:hypothetical protein